METLNYISTDKKRRLDLSLWLDDYEDIYSDFDSRSYLNRRVSSDFLDELRSAFKNKEERLHDLVLLLPNEKRDAYTELRITQSLKSYFNKQLEINNDKYANKWKQGIILFVVAISLMLINAIISFKLDNNFISSILRIILEPSGWFLAWISFDILYYNLGGLKKEREFFKELSEVDIYFQTSNSSKNKAARIFDG